MAIDGTSNNTAVNFGTKYAKIASKQGDNLFSQLFQFFSKKPVSNVTESAMNRFVKLDENMMTEALNCDINFRQPYVAPNDAIPAVQPKAYPFKIKRVAKNNSKKDWKEMYAFYKPSDPAKYNRVLNFIKKNKNLTDKSLAPKIANMVCKLSDNYGIDPEIIVKALEAETGGYKFTPDVMVNKDSKYKGVMQVDLDNIKIMYADESKANDKSLSDKERRIAYSHRFFRADDKRINQLKRKYKTPEALYAAIQKDVSLGLEVGIMVFKSKLNYHQGNVDAALGSYCGKGYKMPRTAKYPKKIYPVPTYAA